MSIWHVLNAIDYIAFSFMKHLQKIYIAKRNNRAAFANQLNSELRLRNGPLTRNVRVTAGVTPRFYRGD